MTTAGDRRWGWTLILVGLGYFAVGITFAMLAGAAASHQGRVAWRLLAWLTSAIAFMTHIGYEQTRLLSSPRVTAFHASLAVAMGACALAAAATIRALVSGTGNLRLLAISLVA